MYSQGDDWASFDTEIWWPPASERREQMQFRVPTDRLPSFSEQLREFVRLERGVRLKMSNYASRSRVSMPAWASVRDHPPYEVPSLGSSRWLGG